MDTNEGCEIRGGSGPTSTHGIQEEEKLSNSCADIEGVEGLLEAVKLGESWNQLQDVVLQVLGRVGEEQPVTITLTITRVELHTLGNELCTLYTTTEGGQQL